MNKNLLLGIFLSLITYSCNTVLYAQENQPASQGKVIQLKTAAELDSYFSKGMYTIVLFSSLTCGPCKSFHPIYQELAAGNPDVLFLEVVYGQTAGSDQLLNKYGVRAFPTFLFFDNKGNKTNSLTGANENTKNKIIGEIANLKAGTSRQSTVVSEVVKPQGARQQQQATPQPMPMKQVGTGKQPVKVQQPMARPQTAACAVQQPKMTQQPVASPRKRSQQRNPRRPRQRGRVQQ